MEVEITIEQNDDQEQQYIVKCPEQTIKSEKTKTRNKAVYNFQKCQGCLRKEVCSIFKNKGTYYFT
jgi:Pyruvate/2-oxoacid:ferredoxin oxidoreductase delta subunit